MIIPHTSLAIDTLRNLIEEFVTREGTDYGGHTYTLGDKVQHVMRQLEQGSAVILYDSRTETCHIDNSSRIDRLQEFESCEA